MKYLNHWRKVQIPTEFLEIGMEDCSWKNDEVGSMGHPKVENFVVYPVADYLEAIHGFGEVKEIPTHWFLMNLNCPEDSEKELTPAEVVEFFKSKL